MRRSRKPRPWQREPGWWSRGLQRVQERFWAWRQSRQARSERGVLDPDSAFPEQRFTAGLELPAGALQQSWSDDPNTVTGLATEHWLVEQALTPQRVEERRLAPAEEVPSDAVWEEESGESEEELEEEELAEEDQVLEEFEESEEELAEDGEEAFEEDSEEEVVEEFELDVEVKDTSGSPRGPLELSGESPPASPATPVPDPADSTTSPPVSCSSPPSPFEVPVQLPTTPSHFGAASPATEEEDSERLKVKLQRLEMELAALWQQIEDDKKATEACHLEALQFMAQGDCLAEGLAAERERRRELSGSKQAKQHEDDDCRYWADAPFLAFREVSPCDVAAELRRLQAFVEAQDVQVLRLEGQLARQRRAADAVIRKLSAAREHVLSQRRQTTELQEALKEVSAGPFLEAGLGDGVVQCHLEPSSPSLFAPTGRKRPTLLLPAPTPAVCRSQLRV